MYNIVAVSEILYRCSWRHGGVEHTDDVATLLSCGKVQNGDLVSFHVLRRCRYLACVVLNFQPLRTFLLLLTSRMLSALPYGFCTRFMALLCIVVLSETIRTTGKDYS